MVYEVCRTELEDLNEREGNGNDMKLSPLDRILQVEGIATAAEAENLSIANPKSPKRKEDKKEATK